MTDRRAYARGAAILAVGGLLGIAAALSAGRPGALWRPLAIGSVAYAAGGALVLHWGLVVYGARGALAALALGAATPPVLAALGAPALLAPAGGTTLAGSLAQLAAAYALMRCLLDPTVQWVLAAAVAILATPVGAFLHGSSLAVMLALAAFSTLLIVGRVATAERWEARWRLAHAGIVSVAMAWGVALGVALLVAAASHLPSVEEYSEHTSPPTMLYSLRAIVPVAADDAAPAPATSAPAGLAGLPLAALLLAALRPWRWERRYTDAVWLAALACLGGALWLAWGEPGGVFMTPFAALLAGACWDPSRPLWARRAATFVVVVQVVVVLVSWPQFPGGVRSDAWLLRPDFGRPEMLP